MPQVGGTWQRSGNSRLGHPGRAQGRPGAPCPRLTWCLGSFGQSAGTRTPFRTSATRVWPQHHLGKGIEHRGRGRVHGLRTMEQAVYDTADGHWSRNDVTGFSRLRSISSLSWQLATTRGRLEEADDAWSRFKPSISIMSHHPPRAVPWSPFVLVVK
jgi:hypothetical protein